MCGIAGEIRFDGQQASVALVQQMNDHQQSRGPDGSGIFTQNAVALGHRRLKIIDLSERAQQPMVDSELGLAIVFNGAIYNYPELRQELVAKGYRFFSNGDTEVILKAYHAWGEGALQRLNGMFAMAIWQRDTGTLFLARDRLGIKPLYFAQFKWGVRFASTLPALAKTPEIDRSINPIALHHYLSFHSVVPPPHTIFSGVQKLPPGQSLTLKPNGEERRTAYWNVSYGAHSDDHLRDANDWQALTLEVLRTAVRRRLLADVPVGVLLSGGLDSSLIVGLLAEAGQAGLATFSVGFEAVRGESGDEFAYSDIIAKRFSTNHHQIFVPAADVLTNLPNCVAAMSEPMVSHDAIGFYLLCQEVAKHVKVVQSGQGADEVFAGYHWYPPMMQADDAVGDYAAVFFDRDHSEMQRLVHPAYCTEDFSRQFVSQHFQQAGASLSIDKALRLDTNVMLVDDPVKRVDTMTMAWGLEARVPFLDHEVVELAARIPAAQKVQQGGKFVLKQAARQLLPPEVIDRPKGYFPVPALKYLQGPYLKLVQAVLSAPAAKERQLFQADYVAELLRHPAEHITPLGGSKLWQVALLELWLQTHNV